MKVLKLRIRARTRARIRPLSVSEAEQVLAMVEAAALQVAAVEYRDAFDDYARLLRATRIVPGTVDVAGDKSAAGIADAPIYIGIGLTLLGQIATRVLGVATDLAIEKGLTDAAAYIKKLLHRGDRAEVEEVAARVVHEAGLPPEADPTVVTQIVLIQIQVLGGVEPEHTERAQDPPTPE